MQPSPMIRANLLAPILDALSAQGHDTAPLLRRHALPFVHPIDPYQLIPLASYVALFEQAAIVLGDPFLGLRLGQGFKPELLGPLGFMFQASADLRAALQQLSSYVSVWQSGTHMELVPGDNTADYIYQIDDPALRPRRQDAEYSISSICSLIRNLLGDKWAPARNPLRARPSRCGPPRREGLCASLPRAGLLRPESQPPGDREIRSMPGSPLLGSFDVALHGASSPRPGPREQGTGKLLPPGDPSHRPPHWPRSHQPSHHCRGTRLTAPFLSAPSRRGANQLSPPGPRPAPLHRRIADKEPHHHRHLSSPHLRLRRNRRALASLQELDRQVPKNLRKSNQNRRNLEPDSARNPMDGCPSIKKNAHAVIGWGHAQEIRVAACTASRGSVPGPQRWAKA